MRLFYFLILFQSVFAEPPVGGQPDRWANFTSDYEFYATKSVVNLERSTGTEFLKFYRRLNDQRPGADPDQIMSVRKNGIYMTAKWDYSHDKVHFLYDGFECDTKQLESFKGSPIFIPEFQNPETAVDYEFVPLLEVLMSPDFVTDVKKVEPEPDLEPTSVRGKVAWQWNARLKYTAKSESYALDVYYSIPTETSVSIPLRVVQYIDEEATAVLQVYEIFRVRLETPPAEVFLLPDLTVCQTSHTPEIPTMSARAWHSKLEVKDYIYGDGGFESPVYDMSIHYGYDKKLARYTLDTAGFKDLINAYGETELEFIHDFSSDLGYAVDRVTGNCSIYSLDPSFGDDPASDLWYHGGKISMHSPEWFWQIPDPNEYWFKGSQDVRYIGADFWSSKRTPAKGPAYSFEWAFSTEDWIFYEGSNPEDSTRTNQPLQLRTRSVKPVTSAGHHHHTDYTIYYYNEAPSANPHKVFDGVQKCFAGARHKFLQVNITDVNQMGPVVKQRFQEQFLKEFQTVLSAAAGVGYLRINRLRELTCGNEICYLQFYLLDKPAHKTADKELGLDEAFNYLQYQIQLGEVRVDMSNYVGYTAVFSADPNTLRTREMIDENVKYEDKYVIDGHSDGAFAGAAVGSIIGGILVGLVMVSSVFQMKVCGIQVPSVGA